MPFYQSILLGVLQGLTEFLPVSSSGHLVLAQNFFGFTQERVLFDVVLHLGTTLAILVYFTSDILKLSKKTIFLLILGSIPAALVGFLFQDFIESLFASAKLVGVALLVTAAMNWSTDRAQARRDKLGVVDALWIGIAQAFAIIPGISRSGSTIFAGTNLGVNRKQAAEFSFLLSVPAVLGANILTFATKGANNGLPFGIYFVGFLASFLTGILAIAIVLRVLLEKRFRYFAIYAGILGILAILL